MALNETIPHVGSHLGYFSGLTMMIPILSESWATHVRPWIVSPLGFFIALGLIAASIFFLAKVSGSFSRLLKNLGWMMIVPGILALVFATTSQESVFHWATTSITGFSVVEPVAHFFVEHSVPKATYLGGFYILFGAVLVWVSAKIQQASNML